MPFKDHHKVNVIEQKASDSRQSSSLSSIVRQVRSLGLAVKDEVGVEGDLIGSRIVGSVRLLGEEYPALIDTGSMISIVPVEVLGSAMDRGYDLDALPLVQTKALMPVFDASNSRMQFLGAVYIEVELADGKYGGVPYKPIEREGAHLGNKRFEQVGSECINITGGWQ